MKKLDKFIIGSFLGPFFLTFLVVVFILLMQYLLKYFEEIVGKGLEAHVYAELLFYFAIHVTSLALPLAVLLSSLMTYGNLGEHFELTAIKSAGISLTRTLVPIGVFTIFLTVFAFFNNNNIVPEANLRAYSLLYDIRQTKPSLSLQEGSFYNGIPNYSIKVNEKYDDGSLGSLIIYDHRKGQGNTDVILADSGRMEMFNNEQYLMMELFNGQLYSEDEKGRTVATKEPANFIRNKFDRMKLVFSLESFNMVETKKEYFASNRVMKNVSELSHDIDSMRNEIVDVKYTIFEHAASYNPFVNRAKVEVPAVIEERYIELDSLAKAEAAAVAARDTTSKQPAPSSGGLSERPLYNEEQRQKLLEEGGVRSLRAVRDQAKNRTIYEPSLADTALLAKVEQKYSSPGQKEELYKSALGQARYMKNNYDVYASRAKELRDSIYKWQIEIHKKWAHAVACFIMFMIGAPLGSIIKRGGLGIPVIISIAFFVIYYVFTSFGEKWAREGIVSPALGMWAANIVLFPFGFLFLWQARNDARLFESDFYLVLISKIRSRLGERIRKPQVVRRSSS
ncbi:LptF/LptG family permease [Nafulsella turpanensis]|uniref:LptF/LptG family permease n=1 Tax=Nafulsella turpanensis TaxID=1265690 RepID=UPI00034C808A|nr:LptF/LptG family permease [Nafulsella turpanensis]